LNDIPIKVEALKDSRLIAWSIEDSRWLYSNGYYGKPLGIPKPKDDFDAPLVLDPVEGVYLLEKGLIEVYKGEEKEEVSLQELEEASRDILEDFDVKLRVYKDLREKGLVVTPGIKYGCDFAVYMKGPGIDHAPYIIQIRKGEDELTAAEIVRSGRIATTVRKTFIVARVKGETIKYLEFKWWRA
jgi:tRNA-intron endonuclease